MMTETNFKMWWPSPLAFSDLTVEDTEEGFALSAPDGTECAEWINYWSQDKEHHNFFEAQFSAVLLAHIKSLDQEYVKNEVFPDGGQSDPEQSENVSSGLLS